MIITTSWDDGDREDLRVKALMDAYGIKGTFYIAQNYRKNRLSENEIRMLASTQEIGAHTISHPDLSGLPVRMQESEVRESKIWLEGVVGKKVHMFCYPGGKFSQDTVDIVRNAGYSGARTTVVGSHQLGPDPYLMGVSMTFYPRLDLTVSRRIIAPLVGFFHAEQLLDNAYPELLRRLNERFAEARAVNGVFHLYGHSWTNAQYGLYGTLEAFFSRIARLPDCEYLTNGEVVARFHAQNT